MRVQDETSRIREPGPALTVVSAHLRKVKDKGWHTFHLFKPLPMKFRDDVMLLF